LFTHPPVHLLFHLPVHPSVLLYFFFSCPPIHQSNHPNIECSTNSFIHHYSHPPSQGGFSVPLDKQYSKFGRRSTYDYRSLLKVDTLRIDWYDVVLTLESWPEFSHYILIEVDRFACYSSACL